ncbi:Transcription factor TFIIIB component B'' like [Dissostichus eleginoides]|uniref:Transcription factor TFIIIB component B'' like n=1 Tax=Dissostichus eleginoides TaxID=100907 RepID=A0AAD9BMH0_DISEL|nr:Transcription factor TFIIIB component B'' like [Dissostichus eleginoides]
MVPQVKVAEDGTLIIDEESLTVEVQRAKGPNPANDRDPIFERGSTTTYSSFRKGTYCKPWSSEETDMFFLAISMVGTDFSMICQLFPLRARSEIKNKFKKEERENSWRIDKAFRERRKLDIEYFSKLLEKILEVQKNRKKLKAMAEKKPPKERKKREKGRKKAGKKLNEAFIPGDKEAALPEDCQKSDMSEKTEGAKDGTIKPAKLSRGRAPKPLLPLGRKRGKKPPPPSTKTNDDASDKGEESVIDGASTEQVKKDASPSRQDQNSKSANNDLSSEEEEATVQPPKPTRYGRVPKPTKPLNYSAKEAAPASASETSPASPEASNASAARPKPKSTAKRGRSSKQLSSQESKKPKLVTLRASHPSRDSSAPVFVPAILRSPHPVISEVEETMEELDILATMPDVLGISQNALCPDDSCEWAQKETGTAEPCEHQLDLLVDVIDFLSIDHAEVSEDESYNEAAQTLLTIGNLAHLSQSAQNQIAVEDQLTGTTSDSVNETSEQLEEEVATKIDAEKENRATPVMSATSVNEVTETSETVTTVELQNIIDNNEIPILESSDQRTGSDMDPTSQLTSKTDSPPTRRARLSKKNSQVYQVQQHHSGVPQKTRTSLKPSLKSEGNQTRETQELTDVVLMSDVKSESRCNNPLKSNAAATDLQLGQGSIKGSVQESKDHPATCVTPVEKLPVEELSGISGATTSQQSASENLNLSEAQFESRMELDTRDEMVQQSPKLTPCNPLINTPHQIQKKALRSHLQKMTLRHQVKMQFNNLLKPMKQVSKALMINSQSQQTLPLEKLPRLVEADLLNPNPPWDAADDLHNTSRIHNKQKQKPVEGAIDQSSNTIPSPKDADTSPGSSTEVIEQLSQHEPLVEVSGLSTGCATQVPDSGTQDASTSNAGGTQGHPSFTIFPDMMLPQDPSDPDEPFFILSLTEIPVSSSGEGVDSVPEPLPSLPVADAPIEQQSVPGESLATPEEQPPPNVTVPVPMEDSNETGVIHVKDPDDGSTEGNQVDPHERTTVHPSTVQETGQNKDETEIPPTKERQTGTRRRETAKLQVKPKTTKRKQTSKTAAAKKAESPPIQTDTTEQLELPGPSVQPEASDDTEPQRGRADHVEVEKETLTDVVDPEGTSSGAKTTRTSSRNRKAKDSDPGKAASKNPKVKTPRAKGKKSTPAAVASTPCEVTPKPGPDPGQHASEHSQPRSEQSPSTSLCPAEGSTSQPSEYMESSSLEEEPTSVSQYFLSDIFTDVEEG